MKAFKNVTESTLHSPSFALYIKSLLIWYILLQQKVGPCVDRIVQEKRHNFFLSMVFYYWKSLQYPVNVTYTRFIDIYLSQIDWCMNENSQMCLVYIITLKPPDFVMFSFFTFVKNDLKVHFLTYHYTTKSSIKLAIKTYPG